MQNDILQTSNKLQLCSCIFLLRNLAEPSNRRSMYMAIGSPAWWVAFLPIELNQILRKLHFANWHIQALKAVN